MRWILPEPEDAALCESLASHLGISRSVAELLCRRGFGESAAAARFLDPKLKSLSDPFLLPDMAAAIDRLLTAIDKRERIVLYGDYDVDGVTSVALLFRVLRAFGADVLYFLPHRIEEGYGLTMDGLARCVEESAPRLLVAVDCGTSAAVEIAHLASLGVDVIVLDHHDCPAALPVCAAVVNPKRGSEFGYLCSAGLAFKTAHALLKRRPLPGFDLRHSLDLVALGTIADLVPLVNENRTLVKRGLEQLSATRLPGLRALMDAAAVKPPLTCRHVAFALAPRMNAAGRLGTAQDALKLLLCDDAQEAAALANSLSLQNTERRSVEDGVFKAAQAQIDATFLPERDFSIVAGSAGWHPGVIGIVASRISRRYNRPTFIVGFDADGLGKGSGRSIPGFSLVAALSECSHLLERHGGHPMAAGLTVKEPRFAEFRERFNACSAARLSAELLQPALQLDAELSLPDLDFDFLCHHEALQPFGMANSEPLYLLRNVSLESEPRILKEKHLSLMLRQAKHRRKAIWFNGAGEPLPPQPWDVAFTLERNEYQGNVTADIRVKAVRTASL